MKNHPRRKIHHPYAVYVMFVGYLDCRQHTFNFSLWILYLHFLKFYIHKNQHRFFFCCHFVGKHSACWTRCYFWSWWFQRDPAHVIVTSPCLSSFLSAAAVYSSSGFPVCSLWVWHRHLFTLNPLNSSRSPGLHSSGPSPWTHGRFGAIYWFGSHHMVCEWWKVEILPKRSDISVQSTFFKMKTAEVERGFWIIFD